MGSNPISGFDRTSVPIASISRVRQVVRSYRFRLQPNEAQLRRLEQMADARRFVWNWALERRLTHYRETGKNLTWSDLSRELTRLKATEAIWLNAADSQALQQALRDLYRAFRAFFNRDAAMPRFKSKKTDLARFRIPQRVTVGDGQVRIPKIGTVRARVSQPIAGIPGAATFKRDAAGRWFVTVTCRFHAAERAPNPNAIGIDLGVRRLMTLSDGRLVENPREHAASERRLRRAHRRLARKQTGSRNRSRQRARLARLHGRVRSRRLDYLHKLTTSIVSDNGTVCIEDLHVRGLARAKLSRDMHDAALGEIRRQLTYKSAWSGRTLVLVSRFYPSTKTCSRCGFVAERVRPDRTEWSCRRCRARLDRDVNAAQNILREGLKRLAAAGHADGRTPVESASDFEHEAADIEAGTLSRDAKSEVSAQPSASL